MVRDGQIALRTAQRQIAADWLEEVPDVIRAPELEGDDVATERRASSDWRRQSAETLGLRPPGRRWPPTGSRPAGAAQAARLALLCSSYKTCACMRDEEEEEEDYFNVIRPASGESSTSSS